MLLQAAVLINVAIIVSGCGNDEITPSTVRTSNRSQTIITSGSAPNKTAASTGLKLDPNLQSITGIPTPAEMPILINLQGKVPYPVIVPTYLPSGYQLETDSPGFSDKDSRDPVGYYSFRYSDPSNPNRSLTFNQSQANSQPPSGYYLTEEEINGINYQVYWHMTSKYLPQGDPVRTTAVGPAETFVITWQSQYTDPATGQPQNLWYSIQSGTWTVSWGEVESVLENLKPLSAVSG